MSAEETINSFNLTELTVDIISAFVSNNSVRPSDLPHVISEVHAALSTLGNGRTSEFAEPLVLRKPAVPIKKSITPDYLISLEDGKPYRTLKRHLRGLGLSPTEYREKWGLPYDYPMVSSAYTAKRSELAKSIGLGRKARGKPVTPEPMPETIAAPKKRGRKPKVSSSAS